MSLFLLLLLLVCFVVDCAALRECRFYSLPVFECIYTNICGLMVAWIHPLRASASSITASRCTLIAGRILIYKYVYTYILTVFFTTLDGLKVQITQTSTKQKTLIAIRDAKGGLLVADSNRLVKRQNVMNS